MDNQEPEPWGFGRALLFAVTAGLMVWGILLLFILNFFNLTK